jgi:hypothetical protein
VFHLAPTHLGRDTQRQIYWSVQGPPGSETPIVGAPGRGLLRVNDTFPLSSRWVDFSNLFSPGRCPASGVSSSCPSTAATTWYSSPRSTTTTTVGSPSSGELDVAIPPRQKRNTRVVPATLLVGGDGDGATVATQEAAPYRLSNRSESTTPALLRGTCRVLSSRLRQRRASLPHNMLAPSRLMTPAPSRRTCWALASYLR